MILQILLVGVQCRKGWDLLFVLNLFKSDTGDQGDGHAFINTGFKNWKHKKTLKDHVYVFDSAQIKLSLSIPIWWIKKQSISYVSGSSSQQKSNKMWLTSVLDCTRFLLMQGLHFRAHNKLKESLNRENIIELPDWYTVCYEEVKNLVFTHVPRIDQMTSSNIQKDLVKCYAIDTTRLIWVILCF